MLPQTQRDCCPAGDLWNLRLHRLGRCLAGLRWRCLSVSREGPSAIPDGMSASGIACGWGAWVSDPAGCCGRVGVRELYEGDYETWGPFGLALQGSRCSASARSLSSTACLASAWGPSHGSGFAGGGHVALLAALPASLATVVTVRASQGR